MPDSGVPHRLQSLPEAPGRRQEHSRSQPNFRNRGCFRLIRPFPAGHTACSVAGGTSGVAPPGDERELVVVGGYPRDASSSPAGKRTDELDTLAKDRARGGPGNEGDARPRPVTQPTGDELLPARWTPRHSPCGGGSWLGASVRSSASVGPHHLPLSSPSRVHPGRAPISRRGCGPTPRGRRGDESLVTRKG